MIVKIQREIRRIKGERKDWWNRLDMLEEQDWCCEDMSRADYWLGNDGKFGDIQYKYVCGEPEEKYTAEIKVCPFCGEPITVEELEPKIITGIKKETITYKLYVVKKTVKEGIDWDDGRSGGRGGWSTRHLTPQEYEEETGLSFDDLLKEALK